MSEYKPLIQKLNTPIQKSVLSSNLKDLNPTQLFQIMSDYLIKIPQTPEITKEITDTVYLPQTLSLLTPTIILW